MKWYLTLISNITESIWARFWVPLIWLCLLWGSLRSRRYVIYGRQCNGSLHSLTLATAMGRARCREGQKLHHFKACHKFFSFASKEGAVTPFVSGQSSFVLALSETVLHCSAWLCMLLCLRYGGGHKTHPFQLSRWIKSNRDVNSTCSVKMRRGNESMDTSYSLTQVVSQRLGQWLMLFNEPWIYSPWSSLYITSSALLKSWSYWFFMAAKAFFFSLRSATWW